MNGTVKRNAAEIFIQRRKSFTSCAVGFAVQEGLLSLDEKLTDAFSEDLPEVVDENLQTATVQGPAHDVS